MTSIWNENFSLFTERFAELAKMLAPQIPAELSRGQNCIQDQDPSALKSLFPFYEFFKAKNGELTASQNGLALHSNYNPSAEAARAAKAAEEEDKDIFVFAGLGLGYLARELAKSSAANDKAFVVLEPDAPRFFAALASVDLSELFRIPKLFFAVGADVEQAALLVQCAGGFEKAKVFLQKASIENSKEWFAAFFKRAEEQKNAAQVNVNTLERFGRLWLKNGARNLQCLRRLGGVGVFFGAADFSQENNSDHVQEPRALPAVLLAAGPSLQDILPRLRQVQERAVTIAVDTALRACLRAGVEPDFIVLTDPQYWASRHLAGLSSPRSILIAESAAYPSVFRFDCKQIVLMSSLFPLGKYFESRLGKKGALASGGSVATSAWDFARAIGSKEIYCSGLDLGYPNKQTHIKGSAFEEAVHNTSSRLNPSETQSARLLFSAKNSLAKNFDGEPIITDERMKLFAWWFEKSVAAAGERTFVFSKKGLAIKGVGYCSIDDFLKKPKALEEKEKFFLRARQNSAVYDKEKFDELMAELKDGLEKIAGLSKKGRALCDDILCGSRRAAARIGELDAIDKEIMQSEAKNVAALVFPTSRQLEEIFARSKFPQEPLLNAAAKSRAIYTELLKSIEDFLKIC